MKRIKLTQGKYALVSDRDYTYLNQWKWCAVKKRSRFYAGRQSSRKDGPRRLIYMHDVVFERSGRRKTKPQLDHRNRDSLDNRRRNLRQATNSENNCNKVCKGYTKLPNGKYQAQIKFNGRFKFLGNFDTAAEAAHAYNKAAKQLHKSFARFSNVRH